MRNTLVIISVLISGFASAQNIARKAVFTKGQQFEKTGSVKMNMNMEMMGQSMEVINTTSMTSSIVVKNASDKDYQVTNTVTRALASVNAMGQEMSYDSDKKEDSTNELGKVLSKKVGKAVNLTVDKKGFITTTDAPKDETLAKALDVMGGMGEGVQTEPNIIGSTFEVIADLPKDRTLKVGDSWADSVIASDGKNRLVNQYKITGIAGDEAQVAIEQLVSKSGTMEQGGQQMNMTLNAKGKGSYTVELSSGVVKKRTYLIEGAGTMEMAGMSIPFTMTTNTEENVKKK